MSLEEFKTKLLEQQLFEELKDTTFSGINYIRNKYDGLDIDYSRLYRKIINYQVKKYGYGLVMQKIGSFKKSADEEKKIKIQRNRRKVYQKNRRSHE